MLTYTNKVILAPMVRVGTLPMRLLALRYGADIVYTEEIIDHKLIHCSRVENQLLGTLDYVASDGEVVFRTCEEEKNRLVFQMGTCDPDRALKAARMLENDISGLDINMGCPKEFSIKGGMGAALLTQPEKVQNILSKLVSGLSIPVTCKIRILPSISDTINLVKLIEKTGVKAIGIHGRTKEERSSLPCHDDYIAKLSDIASIPIIANGGSLEIKTFNDIEKFKEKTKCSSVMIARAAQWDPSIFRKEGSLPLKNVILEYIKLAVRYDSVFQNTKYVLCKMIGDTTKTPETRQVHAARDMQDICVAYELEDYRQNILKERLKLKEKILNEINEPQRKRRKSDCDIQLDIVFNRKLYPPTVSPIQIVHEYCKQNKFHQPVFDTIMNPDRTFISRMKVAGKTYSTKVSNRRKKSAEQASAVVFLRHHGIHDGGIKG